MYKPVSLVVLCVWVVGFVAGCVSLEPRGQPYSYPVPKTSLALTATRPPYPPPATATPPPTATLPPCGMFMDSATDMPKLPQTGYAFSDPRVVLTNTSAIGVADWLPDGESLLITRLIANSLDEYVETYDARTGQVERYGQRYSFDAGDSPRPLWLASANLVAFSDRAGNQFSLQIGPGNGQPTRTVLSNLMSPFVAASPDSRQIVFLPAGGNRPGLLDVTSGYSQTLSLVLPALPASRGPEIVRRLRVAWHPDGHRLAFYGRGGLFVADLTTLQLCQQDLGQHPHGPRWAYEARWSPDGHYLAALTTVGDPAVAFTDLTLVDTRTGELRHLDFGHQYVSAIAWMGSSGNLLVGVELGEDPSQGILSGLYIVDPISGAFAQVRPDLPSLGVAFWGIAWSDARREIALACPLIARSLIVQGRLCIITATAGGQ